MGLMVRQKQKGSDGAVLVRDPSELLQDLTRAGSSPASWKVTPLLPPWSV